MPCYIAWARGMRHSGAFTEERENMKPISDTYQDANDYDEVQAHAEGLK